MADIFASPTPTAEEAAAIAAALDALWPTGVIGEEPDMDRSQNWRFSGRWWRRSRFADPQRPWG